MVVLDESKPARGYTVELFEEGWQALAVLEADDSGPRGHGSWPDGERFHAEEQDAIRASHRYHEEAVKPLLSAFALKVLAYFNHHRDENGEYDCPAWREYLDDPEPLVSFDAYACAQVLAAARGERTLP